MKEFYLISGLIVVFGAVGGMEIEGNFLNSIFTAIAGLGVMYLGVMEIKKEEY